MNRNIAIALLFGAGAYIVLRKTGKTAVINRMADLITYWESGGNTAALSYRNNNPGNLRWFGNLNNIPWNGALGVDQFNHVVFDTFAHGRDALIYQLTLMFNNKSSVYNSKMTLYQVFDKYAEANSENYAEFVAQGFNTTADTSLENLKV